MRTSRLDSLLIRSRFTETIWNSHSHTPSKVWSSAHFQHGSVTIGHLRELFCIHASVVRSRDHSVQTWSTHIPFAATDASHTGLFVNSEARAWLLGAEPARQCQSLCVGGPNSCGAGVMEAINI